MVGLAESSQFRDSDPTSSMLTYEYVIRLASMTNLQFYCKIMSEKISIRGFFA